MMQQPTGVGRPPMAPQPQMGADQQAQQYAQQQQWMMMPPAPQQPVPPPAGWTPQSVPPPISQSQVQQYGAPQSAVGGGEVKSLWIGDLQQWMDESYLMNCFTPGEVLSAKVIRNKLTSFPEGYGFIEFASRAVAERILQTYNGTPMPSTQQNFRLNWATLGAGERRQDDGNDYTIFVGDLAADVTDYLLQETFRAVYASVKGAKVVTDRTTGRSKGYGFVRFGDESEQQRAMTEMNGMFCSSRAMRIGPAATKNPVGTQQLQKATYQSTQGSQGENDPNNTTIFVGGLDSSVTDDHLKSVFSQYGELVHVKIPPGKRCGFVQFANRACAEQALSMLNGVTLGGQNIRLSWGRSPLNKQPDQSQYGGGGGYYGYAQGYDAYGYAPPPQDPSMYYSGYPGYGNYQQPGAYQQSQQ
ncbi:polyadenylate-binding protein RBP45C-like isoform X2 [Tripterygium wilfordii]|uniref:polyadenylate-binding protein RBP45C-like isoform X2 n=1 Tax=Tripterygium wilfordii TaxID=458696 RepID=UPI0018F818D3|nr:polyadenylate-binding protein RBP45C-like isoform X2 [Tripterygium wilfordii]